jgi:osmotically inducible protein OsmC
MQRHASAIWNGDLKSGKGSISSESGAIKDQAYSFRNRFENEPGTNPEELIAAAHAGCFSMALSHELASAGLNPTSVATKATVTLDKVEGGFAITKVHLDVDAKVPGADQGRFDEIAAAAKAGCPVSKVLNAEITMTARLDA